MKKITIDGVEYDAEGKVIETLTQTQVKVDAKDEEIVNLKKDNATIEAERDSLKDENVQLKKDKADAEKLNPEKIDEAVKEKLILRDTAKGFNVEIKDEMSDGDIKKAVVLKAFPNANAEGKLDKAEEVYIQARFDGAVEYLKENGHVDEENRNDLSDHGDGKDGRSDGQEVSAKQKRQDMIERIEKGEGV